MKRKKPAAVLMILAAIVLLSAAAGGYRRLSSLSLSEELKRDVRITSLEVWKPFAQVDNMPVTVRADEETKRQITDLITAPTYYRKLFLNGSGGNVFFMIYLEGRDSSGKLRQYSYLISNEGEVGIRDLAMGNEARYLTDGRNPFIVSRQELRELYAGIARLTESTE
ncbi:MAG TPA: hypothetical protein VN366_05180 [Feifaniaceae bacterium]|nr:hypothetical protein [Feifaniaceae bacterium]